MRILHIHDRWSDRGGADWYLISLLDRLPASLYKAGLFGRPEGTGFEDHAPSGGVHYIKHLDRRAPFAAEQQVGRAVRDFIAGFRPDLIHVHNILNPHLLEVIAGAGPAVITVQDHRSFCPGRGKVMADGRHCRRLFGLHCAQCFDDDRYFLRVLELVQARLAALHRFAAVTVLSRYMRDELVAAGLPADRIHVVPPFVHGLDQTFSPAAMGRTVLFAGRLVWAKGIFDLLEALAMAEERPRLVVAGVGTVEDEIAARVRELGLAERIEFTGWLDHAAMAARFRQARMVVMPSRWQEPFGIVGLEALALGRPVAAFDGGGVRDWLTDGHTGLIIPPGNVLALASSINVLMRDPETATAMGRAGWEGVRKAFTPQAGIEAMVRVYEAVAGRAS